MSSDFYPSSLSRNLIRTGAFAYRENVALGILNRAEDAAGEQQDDRFRIRQQFRGFSRFQPWAAGRPGDECAAHSFISAFPKATPRAIASFHIGSL